MGAEIPELCLLSSRGRFAGEPDHLADYSNVPQLRPVFRICEKEDYRKVLADKLGVTAFHSSEIVDKRRTLDRVLKAIAEKIGRGHRESYPAHNFQLTEMEDLKTIGVICTPFLGVMPMYKSGRPEPAGG